MSAINPGLISPIGARRVMPENTMASFVKAFDMGADMLELDVQLSKDGQVVVIHDSTVERTTDGQGEVGDLTFEARMLDAGSWYDSAFKGEVIPALAEVLEHFAGRIGLLIELKSPSRYPGIEQRVADELKRYIIGADGGERYKDLIIVQSADTDSLLRFRQLMPDIPLGVVITSAGDLSSAAGRYEDLCGVCECIDEAGIQRAGSKDTSIRAENDGLDHPGYRKFLMCFKLTWMGLLRITRIGYRFQFRTGK